MKRPNRKKILETQPHFNAEFNELLNCVSALLFLYDPIHLNFDHNQDEYEPEAGAILPRLKNCHSVAAVRQVVYEEFVRSFDPHIAGPEPDYQPIAEKIWELWVKSKPALT